MTAANPSMAATGSSDRLAALLESLDLTLLQKELLRQRWLDQLGWLGRQARRARLRYYLFRLPIVIGGVAIPALVSVTLGLAGGGLFEGLRWLTFGVSFGVAILAAVESMFQYGDRWRHYRRTAERLKSTGWQYLMLIGAFRSYSDHAAAFSPFTERVEELLGEEVEGYIGRVAVEGDSGRPEVIA